MKKVFGKESYSTLKKSVLRYPTTMLAIALLLVSLLITTLVAQQRQDIRQRAQVITTNPVGININDFQFNPGTITIQQGTTVVWTNRSTQGVPHTSTSDATSGSQTWDSGTLSPGQSFSRTFNQVGTFKYHCNIHGAAIMPGTIVVVASQAQPTPTIVPTRGITAAPTPTRTPTPTVTPTPVNFITPTPTRTPTPSPTPTPTPVVSIAPTSPNGEPPYVCLGSCPTATPTITPTPKYVSPTPTRTPTPEPTSYITVPPTMYPDTPTPTLEPCPVDDTTSIASDNGKPNKNKGNNSIFTRIFEFFMNLISKLLEILFGYKAPPAQQPTPTPSLAMYPTIKPTITAKPSGNVQPTSVQLPTYPPAPTLNDTPMYRPYDPKKTPAPTSPYNPTNTPTPTLTLTPTPYNAATPTPTPYGAPSATPTPTLPYGVTPTPPCIPPTSTPTPYPSATATPTQIPTPLPSGYPTPSDAAASPTSVVSPTRKLTSVADLVYVDRGEPMKEFSITASAVGGNYMFNGTIPGPALRATQGDHIRAHVKNDLPESLTIHWHGLKIESSQDGVAGVTQNAIKPGETLTYDFTVPDAGTYWYHTHQNTQHALPKGLYGSLVVDPKTPNGKYDKDYYVVYRNANISNMETLQASPGDKVRIRMLNSRTGDFAGTPLKIVPVGLPYKIIALDGQDLNKPQEIPAASKLLEIGFAQRYDLEFVMPASGSAMLADSEGMQNIQIGSEAVTPPDGLGSLPVFDMMAYGEPAKDTYLPRTTIDDERTLEIGPNLSINGKLGHEIPDMVVKGQQVVMIHYKNNSNMSHPMHLHGHFYSVMKKNGKAPTGSPIHLDTILLHPGETADVAFYTDIPGVWMLHCHIMAHAAAGLAMVMPYEDIFTPYVMGGTSGNIPE